MRLFILLLLSTLLFTACGFQKLQEQANQKFGDQHFKTAVALIELHKLREGSYPEALSDLKYMGDWDAMIYSSVKYTKLEEGYELDLVNGWVGAPEELEYPEDFWKGLGIRKSNLMKTAVTDQK